MVFLLSNVKSLKYMINNTVYARHFRFFGEGRAGGGG